jgi:ankyrin repeat protein
LDDRIDRDTIKSFPLAQYAAEHWVKHAQFENVALRIKDGMERLFDADKSHFATWLWICDREYGDSMTTMCPGRPRTVPLYYATLYGFRDLTEHLLAEHPEDVHAKGGLEVTPLHASARHGHADIFLLLVEHFPNVDIQGIHLQTPLHRASYGGHIEIGQWLLDRGAGINDLDNDDWTPLFVAALHGHLEFARMLLERGAAINTPDDDDDTPLHKASEQGYLEVVRLLLDHGADLNAYNDDDLTPIEVASNREIVQLLSEYREKSVQE